MELGPGVQVETIEDLIGVLQTIREEKGNMPVSVTLVSNIFVAPPETAELTATNLYVGFNLRAELPQLEVNIRNFVG